MRMLPFKKSDVPPLNQGVTNSMITRPSLKPTLHAVRSQQGYIIFDPAGDRFLAVNLTAFDMWFQLSQGKTAEEVVAYIAAQCKAPSALVECDLRALLRTISAHALTTDCVLLVDQSSNDKEKPSQGGPSFPWYCKDANQSSCIPPRSMILCALAGLVLFELILFLRNFDVLCKLVHKWKINPDRPQNRTGILKQICAAVDRACIWYPKKAVCLQRSAVTTCLLRSHGISARMMIGVHALPFAAHVWVQADDDVVNDFPNVQRFYQSLTAY